MLFEWLADPAAWAALLTLTAMEVVLGIDNIIFISILADRLPPEQQPRARRLGLLMAMGTRILLLLTIAWMMKLTAPLFGLFGHEFSGKDLILIAGGLFLLAKATHEIHAKVEEPGEEGPKAAGAATATMAAVVAQIALLDVVFSLDSVITAVGMTGYIEVMVIAVVVSVLAMIALVGSIHRFIQRHPTIKMLALSFLLLIGVMLVADGLGFHIPKGYIYFAMAFSAGVEMLNLRVRSLRARAGT